MYVCIYIYIHIYIYICTHTYTQCPPGGRVREEARPQGRPQQEGLKYYTILHYTIPYHTIPYYIIIIIIVVIVIVNLIILLIHIIYIYIYMHRERERDRERDVYVYVLSGPWKRWESFQNSFHRAHTCPTETQRKRWRKRDGNVDGNAMETLTET